MKSWLGRTVVTNGNHRFSSQFLRRRKICLSFFQKLWFICLVRSRHEGRIAIVTTREGGCGGCGRAQHDPIMRTNAPLRTVKSWRSDLPVLRSSRRGRCACDGGKRAGPREDHV